MRFQSVLSAFVVAAAIAGSSVAAHAGTTVKVVRGPLAAAATDGTADGVFRLTDVAHDGTSFQRVVVLARGLDAAGATDPKFEVVLDNGTATADLGVLRLATSGTRGYFRFDTRTGTLPSGMTDLTAFSGGTLRISLGGIDVATAAIPVFAEPDSTDPAATDSIAFGYGSVVLGDTSEAGSGPVAKLTAYAVNSPAGVSQGIVVGAFALSRGATYTVVLTGATEDTLGVVKASNFLGLGGLLVSTRRGDTIPGGSVGALAGRGIEIRDAAGAVVLSGTMPSLH